MQIKFYYILSGKELWAETAKDLYEKKINHFYPFKIQAIKTKSLSRDKQNIKVKMESAQILKLIEPNEWLILFDETGKRHKDSIQFSQDLNKSFELGKQKITFLIGGSYGVSAKIKQRANVQVSLTELTLNHHVAITVALEQIYRAICIQKNIPYHNQ